MNSAPSKLQPRPIATPAPMFGVLLSNPIGVGVGVGALHTSDAYSQNGTNITKNGSEPEVCRAPTPTPTQTGLDSTTPNIGAGVAIGRGWSLDGAEFKASS